MRHTAEENRLALLRARARKRNNGAGRLTDPAATARFEAQREQWAREAEAAAREAERRARESWRYDRYSWY